MRYIIERTSVVENVLTKIFVLYCLSLICTMPYIATAQVPPCSSTDIDTDNDNLIDICDIQGLEAIRDNPSGEGTSVHGCSSTCNGFELMADVDFYDNEIPDGIYNWQPIEFFNSIFNANGRTISNLIIDRPDTDFVGLFGETGSRTEIIGVRLLNVDIIGNNQVGGLVGSNGGEISGSCIVNTDTILKVEGNNFVGGLVGDNVGTITNSYTIIEARGNERVGGLVGDNIGTIANSRTTSTIVGSSNEIGGLIGWNNAVIIGSYAFADVTGEFNSFDSGGLVGLNDSEGRIINSYAIGTLKGFDFIGGLVGHNFGVVINSYAAVEVNGDKKNIGGLVGRNKSGTILNSYAAGDVIGRAINSGGLVGENDAGKITNAYATGDVISATVNYVIGGLVGRNNNGTIRNTYAIGNVRSRTENREALGTGAGGLVGINNQGNILYSYAKDRLQLVGSNNNGKITAGFTTNIYNLHLPIAPGTTTTEVYYNWDIADWDFGTEQQFPILKYAPGPYNNMPACNESTQLPGCDDLLLGQLGVFIYTNIKVLLEGALP